MLLRVGAEDMRADKARPAPHGRHEHGAADYLAERCREKAEKKGVESPPKNLAEIIRSIAAGESRDGRKLLSLASGRHLPMVSTGGLLRRKSLRRENPALCFTSSLGRRTSQFVAGMVFCHER